MFRDYLKKIFFLSFCIILSSQVLLFNNLFGENLLSNNVSCEDVCDCVNCDKKQVQKWTWSYKKTFSDLECSQNSSLDGVSFFKENVKNFSQLVFSWNASRPKNGGFEFYIKTRDAKSKKWSEWHKMFNWGSDGQKSYTSIIPGEATQYFHVRFETGLATLADAFRINIKPYGDADLGFIRFVCACTADFNKFKSEKIDDNLLDLKSVHIKDVPKISQRLVNHTESARICSPTSCSMLAGFFGKMFTNKPEVDVIGLVNNVFDPGIGSDGIYGNWCFNTAELYCRCQDKVLCYVTRMNGFSDLHEKLLYGCPIVVSVRGKLEGGQKEYSAGHLMVVVGWDSSDKTVICHDPAFYTDESTFVKYKLETFLKGWEGRNRMAYVASFKK